MGIFFDVDDTLYDQVEPFRRALNKNFSNIDSIDVEKLFSISRKYSDKVFEQTEKGEMSLRDMHIYRISKAFGEFGYYITSESALAFQMDYEKYQEEITILPVMKEILEFLKSKKIKNWNNNKWPREAPEKKISTLGLSEWIPEENMIISGEVGFAKPNKEVFRLAEERIKVQDKNIYFVGDSFENDVMGAINAGWIPIWINKRRREIFNRPESTIHEVKNNESILKVIENIVSDLNRK